MASEKFVVGERVEVLCDHIEDSQRVNGWLAGQVIQADRRMVAVLFDPGTEVFTSNGYPVPDRTLWCAHGSRNIRRIDP